MREHLWFTFVRRDQGMSGQLKGTVEAVGSGKQSQFHSGKEPIGFVLEVSPRPKVIHETKNRNAMTVITSEAMGSVPADPISIIHDFRNPLTAIHASAEMLLSQGLSEPHVQRLARNIYGASVRMQELLDEFLGRCGGASRDPELSDIRELANNAVSRIAAAAEFQSVAIVQDVPEGLEIVVDRHRIHRVLVNLLVNALEVMPNGGTIRIAAVAEPGAVLIQVRDTGPGIAPEIRGRLFQPFATVGKPKGVGLGLAFSRQTVIDHGGEMWANSSVKGSCFSVRLPATAVRGRALMAKTVTS
jgi:signal transduction histidine kinase